MTNIERAATLRDIAELCGVSVPTVSKVLNGRGTVSRDTYRRIMAAVEELDFRPNGLAKAFALGRSFTVGVLAQNANSSLASRVILGLSAELSKNDIAVLIYDDVDDPSGIQNARARASNLRTLQSRRVDGVVVVSDGNDQVVPSVSSIFDCPVINAYSRSTDPEDTCFEPDDVGAGLQAAQHLVNQGRTRIAHVTGRSDSRATIDRLSGVMKSLAENGIPLALAGPLYGNWSIAWGMQAGYHLLERLDEFDAVVCGNDYIATGIHRVFERAGVRVPDDVALIGYDNRAQLDTVNADNFLTTMDPRLSELGRLAAQAIVTDATHTRPTGVVLQGCVLVPGVSSGAVTASPV